MEQKDLTPKQPPKPIAVKPAKKQLAVSKSWFRRQEDGDALFDRVLERMVQIDIQRRRRRRLIVLGIVLGASAIVAGGYILWKATLIER